jgi:hypothetical protein
MSNEELNKELENYKNYLKIANAKIAAANHTLGLLMGENNELKASVILYQEKEKELINHNNTLQLQISELDIQMKQEFKKAEEMNTEFQNRINILERNSHGTKEDRVHAYSV